MIENLCPQPDCRAVLLHHSEGAFDTWVCPKGHGAAATIQELWGHFQDDEIKSIWNAAKTGTPNNLKSPGLGLPMVTVTVTVDDDETEGNEGTNARKVTVDVSPDEEFVWFDVGELELFNDDLPNPEPSADELAKIQQISTTFVNSWAEETIAASKKGAMGHLRAAGDNFADRVDPNGKISRELSEVIPGKSSDEVIKAWGPEDDVTVYPETPDPVGESSPKKDN